MREKHEIESLMEQVLSKASAPNKQVEYYYTNSLATRLGENAITQNTGGEEENIRLIVAYGNRHGSSITNRLDVRSIDSLVDRAQAIAKNTPEDPEYMPPLKPQRYPEMPQKFYEDVAGITPADITTHVATVVDAAKKNNYTASGIFEGSYSITAIANSEGLSAFDRNSTITYSTTIHGPRGSGHASECGESARQVDAGRMARRALDTAIQAQDPQDIEPGDYTVIFEPQAVFDLLTFFIWNLSARDADEGTTVFAGKVGQKIFSDKVTLSLEVDDPVLPVRLYGEDGLPLKQTTWVRNGVLERLRHDRYWAQQKNTNPDPMPYPIFMEGEDRSTEALIADCERALLVKRLWYIRYVDRRELLLTGMSRDGLFLIEKGKVTGPVKNLRFNESPVVFLKNVVATSRQERVSNWAKVPGVMSENFTFHSTTESL
jgi:predicted Zn-dependent protease